MVESISVLTITWLFHVICKNKNVYFAIVYSVFAITVGIRGASEGTDTLAYIKMYDFFSNNVDFSVIHYLEFGVRVVIFIASLLYDDYQSFLFLSSCITYLGIGVFVYKNTSRENYWIATFLIVALGFYSFSFNGLRQALCIGVGVNSLQYLSELKFAKALFISILAALFHFSGVVLVVFALISWVIYCLIKKGANYQLLIPSIAVLVMAAMMPIVKILVENIEVFNKFNVYFSDGFYSEQAELGALRYFLLMCYVIVVALLLVKEKTIDYRKIYVALYGEFAVVFTLLQVIFMYIFYRLVCYFDVYMVIGMPMIISRFREATTRWFVLLLLIIGGYVSVIHMVLAKANGVGGL